MFKKMTDAEYYKIIDSLTYEINDDEIVRLLKEHSKYRSIYSSTLKYLKSDLDGVMNFNNTIEAFDIFISVRLDSMRNCLVKMEEINEELKNRNFNIEEHI